MSHSLNKLPPLSEAQLEIMEIVWSRPDVSVGEVWQELVARRDVARNTVLTLMDRLAKKGWLKKQAEGHVHRYRAAATRKATLQSVVRRLVDTAFAGSAEALVLSLLGGCKISPDEAERIGRLIREARRRESRGQSE
jgi:predicted transcriptional regulator